MAKETPIWLGSGDISEQKIAIDAVSQFLLLANRINAVTLQW